MNENIRPENLKQKIDEINKGVPNLIIPTMGIISENNELKIDNNEFIQSKEVKDDQTSK